MVSKRMLWFLVADGLSLAGFGQKLAPVPRDPLEIVSGPIDLAYTPSSRDAVVRLLNMARNRYALRKAGRSYDLKVSFTVNSGGQTEYDGAWQMEDVFDPQQGLRWTASAAAGYATTQISTNGKYASEGTASAVPLRLHEARAALFDPLPSAANVDRSSIRTSTSKDNGIQVTCVLLSRSGNTAASEPGVTGRKRRRVSIHNQGRLWCIRRFLDAITLTIIRTLHTLGMLFCLER